MLIYKKGSGLECSNYKLISVLPNIGKIMEKLIYNRLYNFLRKYELMLSIKHRFQQKYLTNHALINLT